MESKKYRIGLRISKSTLNKLLSICSVTKKTRTAIIEDLILKEFSKRKEYEQAYYNENFYLKELEKLNS